MYVILLKEKLSFYYISSIIDHAFGRNRKGKITWLQK